VGQLYIFIVDLDNLLNNMLELEGFINSNFTDQQVFDASLVLLRKYFDFPNEPTGMYMTDIQICYLFEEKPQWDPIKEIVGDEKLQVIKITNKNN